MENERKQTLARILLAAALLLVCALLPLEGPPRLAAFLIPYLLAGWDVLWKAFRNIVHGEVFDECFLMAVATLGAVAIGEYPEAVFVMLFYQIGELFQDVAVDRSRASIAALMDIRPDSASVERAGGVETVPPEAVAVGETIVIRPGERVPLDGVVLEGSSALDTAALTGEPLPRDVAAGDGVVSGCVNLTGLLRVRTTKEYGDSTAAKILDLVENAAAKKSKSERFITRFARWYTPAVVAGALALALIPSLLTGDWRAWVGRALTFLVVSCPCALVVSVPLTFFCGLGACSRQGVLVKGGGCLEALAAAEIVVFDKTGTLTRGEFRVSAVHPAECSEVRLLELAALAESWSSHPIARSLRDAYGGDADQRRVGGVVEIAGRGVKAEVDDVTVCVGGGRLMEDCGASWRPCRHPGAAVHVAAAGEYLGHIVLSDAVKPDAAQAVDALKKAGVKKTVLLTGDAPAAGEAVGRELGLDEVHAGLLPADKVARVEDLLAQRSPKGTLCFVGDGVNDAPVLSRADVGVAMGALGSDAAIEAADVVLMDDKLSKLPAAVAIARKTVRIARENIVFALAVKALILLLGALGCAGLWAGAFADAGVMAIAAGSAARALRADG